MLSIIIPTLNEEKYLPKLLKLIKEQSFNDYEIIISDACSEDRTLEVSKSYNCRIVVGDKNKRHPSIQRNDGVKNANGDLILFLDADTILVDKFFLEKTINDFKRRNLGVAGFYMKLESSFFYKIYKFIYNKLAFLAQYFKPLAVGAAIIIKKELHDKINGFDESIFIGEDQDYCERASKIEKFRLITKDVFIVFSTRRFKEEGKWKLFIKLIYATFYVLFLGKIKKRIIKYTFGKHK